MQDSDDEEFIDSVDMIECQVWLFDLGSVPDRQEYIIAMKSAAGFMVFLAFPTFHEQRAWMQTIRQHCQCKLTRQFLPEWMDSKSLWEGWLQVDNDNSGQDLALCYCALRVSDKSITYVPDPKDLVQYRKLLHIERMRSTSSVRDGTRSSFISAFSQLNSLESEAPEPDVPVPIPAFPGAGASQAAGQIFLTRKTIVEDDDLNQRALLVVDEFQRTVRLVAQDYHAKERWIQALESCIEFQNTPRHLFLQVRARNLFSSPADAFPSAYVVALYIKDLVERDEAKKQDLTTKWWEVGDWKFSSSTDIGYTNNPNFSKMLLAKLKRNSLLQFRVYRTDEQKEQRRRSEMVTDTVAPVAAPVAAPVTPVPDPFQADDENCVAMAILRVEDDMKIGSFAHLALGNLWDKTKALKCADSESRLTLLLQLNDSTVTRASTVRSS